MTKKKVAICFSGQMRNVQRGFDYIDQNIIQNNLENWDFDVFVHTWFDKSNIGKQYMSAAGIVASEQTSRSVIDLVYDLYNPVRFLSEKQKEFNEKDYNDRRAEKIIPKYSLSKNYSLKKAGQLLFEYSFENNIDYDAVISLRFDFGPKSKIDLNELDLTHVNMSTHGVWQDIGVDVTHGFMNSKLFFEYHQFYNYIDDLYRKHNVIFCDEHLFHKYLDIKHIPYHRNGYLNNYDLLRA